MNCDVDKLMEAIRDLSDAMERKTWYHTKNAVQYAFNLSTAKKDYDDAWAKIEAMTGGKRP